MTTTTKEPADLLPEDFTFEVDKSRPHAIVCGEHQFKVGFVQDHIPYDVAGKVCVAALNHKEEAKNWPNAKAALARKKSRLVAEIKAATETPITDTNNELGESQQNVADDPDAEVDLVQWAYGNVKLLPHVVYRVAKSRYGKYFRTFAEITAEMVKQKHVDPSRVKV
jgi:hypothetical protein